MSKINFRVPLGGLLVALVLAHGLASDSILGTVGRIFPKEMHRDLWLDPSAEVNDPSAERVLLCANLLLAPVTGISTVERPFPRGWPDPGELCANSLGTSVMIWGAVLLLRAIGARARPQVSQASGV